MATKQHSSRKITRKRVQYSAKQGLSKRSAWAANMHGADPEWLHTKEARNLAIVFGGNFPGWLIESEPWHPATPGGFRFLRSFMLSLSTEQCGAYLGVHRATICRWESGDVPVPKAAYEALRLLSRTAMQRLSHKHWDGWFINRDGELVSPDNGRLAVKPGEINSLPALYSLLSTLRLEITSQAEAIAVLQVENTALRSGDRSRQTAAELQAMQERITGLLATINTAEIIEFNQSAGGNRLIA